MEILKFPQTHYNLSCVGAFPVPVFCLKSRVCNGNLKIPAKPLQTFKKQPCPGNRLSPETKKFVIEFLKSPQNHSKGRKHTLKPSGRRTPKVPKKGSRRPESKEPPKGSHYLESKESPKGSHYPESKEFRTKTPEQEVRRSKDKEDFYGT